MWGELESQPVPIKATAHRHNILQRDTLPMNITISDVNQEIATVPHFHLLKPLFEFLSLSKKSSNGCVHINRNCCKQEIQKICFPCPLLHHFLLAVDFYNWSLSCSLSSGLCLNDPHHPECNTARPRVKHPRNSFCMSRFERRSYSILMQSYIWSHWSDG